MNGETSVHRPRAQLILGDGMVTFPLVGALSDKVSTGAVTGKITTYRADGAGVLDEVLHAPPVFRERAQLRDSSVGVFVLVGEARGLRVVEDGA